MINGGIKYWKCLKCTKMLSVEESLECLACHVKVYE